jgi:hypothetical protein
MNQQKEKNYSLPLYSARWSRERLGWDTLATLLPTHERHWWEGGNKSLVDDPAPFCFISTKIAPNCFSVFSGV